MSPRGFRPAAAAEDLAVAVRQVNPFRSYYTTTSTSTTPAPTPTPTEIDTDDDETDSPATDWAEVYQSGYSKYYSEYSEYYHHATTPGALTPTVTATMTVTGANAGATTTGAYDRGSSQNDHPDDHSSGLGSSAIAGIAVGSVLGLSVLGALLVWFCLRGRQQPFKDGEVEEVDHAEPHSPHSPHSPPPHPYPENMGGLAPQAPMAGPVGPSAHGDAAHAAVATHIAHVAHATHIAHVAHAANGPSRLPSPFRQRHQMHMQAGSDDETVAFAKASNTVPARSLTDEDPPSYEETEGHRRVAGGSQGNNASLSVGAAEFAAGSVSDGFRRYHEQPVQDAESKSYDPLAPSSRT
ncbi:hypothetical protein F503_00689 [Ophiostoma piceae UAMH 11346]|uniref:Transmembrane protein n=1 Tax=Ophiostoma piceae (strain UAMH 11346) TaxID=1262450 RepID=S3BSN5_OPHP1|nr:hypothetical protein F503_00689 [Ophiostoma piceae UAMH 11346]